MIGTDPFIDVGLAYSIVDQLMWLVGPNRLVVTDLEVKVEALPQVDLFGEAFVLSHVEGQRVVTVGVLALRQEHGVVEADELAARHPLRPLQK